jgi:hypothetical protein
MEDASISSEGEAVVLRIPLPAGSESAEVLYAVREALLRLDRYSKMT